MLKRLLLALLLLPGIANAQFTNGQVLTAAQLNSAFSATLPITGGTLTGPLTAPSATFTSPLGFASGGTGATTATGATGSLEYLQGATGSAARSVTNKFQDTVNIRDFGVQCNGTNEYTNINAAFSYAQANDAALMLPTGANVVCGVTSTLVVTSPMSIVSDGGIDTRPKLAILGGANAPLIQAESSITIDNVDLVGSATSSTTSQYLLYINNANNVEIKRSLLAGGYNLIYADGSSFYTTINDVTLYSAINAQLYVNSSTSSGVDMIMDNVRFLSSSLSQYGMYFNGLGSILANNVQMSTNNPAGASIYFDQPAPSYGGAQFTNLVAENGVSTTAPAIAIVGSSATPWNSIIFDNTLATGNNGVAIQAGYVNQLRFSNSQISSVNSNGGVNFTAGDAANDVMFDNVDFEGLAGVTPIQAGSGASVSASLINPRWGGSSPLVNITSATSVPYFNVYGGNLGTSTSPILLPSATTNSGVMQRGGSLAIQNGSVSSNALVLTNANAGGASILMIGNGATTPSKTISVTGGQFGIFNSAVSANIFSLTDAGALTVPGAVNGQGGIQSNGVAINPVLSGTTGSIGGSALAAGACSAATVSVSGATTSMTIDTSPVAYPGDGVYWRGYVSAAGTVTVKVCASVAATPTASAYNVRVIQ